MIGLVDLADIYIPDEISGDFTILARGLLPCRLAYSITGSNTAIDAGDERERISSRRRLLWQDDYIMPDSAQVEVDGRRWNVLEGTFSSLRAPNKMIVYYRCDVERAHE